MHKFRRFLTQTGRDEIEERWLGSFVDMHHEDGEQEAGDVGWGRADLIKSAKQLWRLTLDPEANNPVQ